MKDIEQKLRQNSFNPNLIREKASVTIKLNQKPPKKNFLCSYLSKFRYFRGLFSVFTKFRNFS